MTLSVSSLLNMAVVYDTLSVITVKYGGGLWHSVSSLLNMAVVYDTPSVITVKYGGGLWHSQCHHC